MKEAMGIREVSEYYLRRACMMPSSALAFSQFILSEK